MEVGGNFHGNFHGVSSNLHGNLHGSQFTSMEAFNRWKNIYFHGNFPCRLVEGDLLSWNLVEVCMQHGSLHCSGSGSFHCFHQLQLQRIYSVEASMGFHIPYTRLPILPRV